MNRIIIPTTIRQAFKIVDEMLTPEDKARFLQKTRGEFTSEQHFGLGLWIRNNWLYGDPDTDTPTEQERRDKCMEMLSKEKQWSYWVDDPDHASERFLQKYYGHLKRIGRKLFGEDISVQ